VEGVTGATDPKSLEVAMEEEEEGIVAIVPNTWMME